MLLQYFKYDEFINSIIKIYLTQTMSISRKPFNYYFSLTMLFVIHPYFKTW